MDDLVIRDLSQEALRALEERAERHGLSVSAEIREIVEAAVLPARRVKAGSLFASLGREFDGIEFDIVRDRTPAEPANFD